MVQKVHKPKSTKKKKQQTNYSEKKYPLTPGYKEQSTSKEAAGKVNTRAAKLRTEILQILERK